MQLTVIIPTRDRLPTLLETVARLARQQDPPDFETIVVDDGSTDGTRSAVDRYAAAMSFPLRVVESTGSGPAAARNRAISVAQGSVCLFLNDDTWPRPDLLARHRDFHRRKPEHRAALLGHIALAPVPAPTPFMRWLAGVHFGFDRIQDHDDAGGRSFFTANVSAKTAFLRTVGGFDESFSAAAHEDIDLGMRLDAVGMRLAYDPEAVVEHSHPRDLAMAVEHCRMVGVMLAPFVERYPQHPTPRRPSARHRLKAATLTGLDVLGVRTPRIQQETWRFLCHEATREGYWDVMDDRGGEPPRHGPRIGRRLARLASRDEDARLPSGG